MSLHNRINQLERTLGALPCTCPNNANLSWPGHQPDPNCPTCGGQRLIYPRTHHPRNSEPLIRAALPILTKAYNGNQRADLSNLTDNELDQLKSALQVVEEATPQASAKRKIRAEESTRDFKNRCSIH
jgi:hypothetical protein